MIFSNNASQTCARIKKIAGVEDAYLGFAEGELAVFATTTNNIIEEIRKLEGVTEVKILNYYSDYSEPYYRKKRKRGLCWEPPSSIR